MAQSFIISWIIPWYSERTCHKNLYIIIAILWCLQTENKAELLNATDGNCHSDNLFYCIQIVNLQSSIQVKKATSYYNAVFSPQDRSKRFTHQFSGRPVQPDTISTSLGSIQLYAAISTRRLLVHLLSIARYSFIQLNELEQCRVKNLLTVLTPQHRIWTRVLLVESPKLYPWATLLHEETLYLSITWQLHLLHEMLQNQFLICDFC